MIIDAMDMLYASELEGSVLFQATAILQGLQAGCGEREACDRNERRKRPAVS